MTYYDLVTMGDVIPLKTRINVDKLFDEIEGFEFKQYNTYKKDIPRKGLSITHNPSLPYGSDLESLLEVSNRIGREIRDSDFCKLTDVYYKSQQIKNVLNGFENHIGRTHILTLNNGGYFPPHRDIFSLDHNCHCMRIFVPLRNCNPPNMYFSIDEKVHYWEHGRSYFINTNKMHHLFAYEGPSSFIVSNVLVNDETINHVIQNVHKI